MHGWSVYIAVLFTQSILMHLAASYRYSQQYCRDTLTARQLYVGEVFTRPGQCVRVQCLGTLQVWEDTWVSDRERERLRDGVDWLTNHMHWYSMHHFHCHSLLTVTAVKCRLAWRGTVMCCRPLKPIWSILNVVPYTNAKRSHRIPRGSWSKRIRMIMLAICANHIWPRWLS